MARPSPRTVFRSATEAVDTKGTLSGILFNCGRIQDMTRGRSTGQKTSFKMMITNTLTTLRPLRWRKPKPPPRPAPPVSHDFLTYDSLLPHEIMVLPRQPIEMADNIVPPPTEQLHEKRASDAAEFAEALIQDLLKKEDYMMQERVHCDILGHPNRTSFCVCPHNKPDCTHNCHKRLGLKLAYASRILSKGVEKYNLEDFSYLGTALAP